MMTTILLTHLQRKIGKLSKVNMIQKKPKERNILMTKINLISENGGLPKGQIPRNSHLK